MHGRESVLAADVKIRLTGFFTEDVRRAGCVELDRSRHQVRVFRKDIAILANSSNFAADFHVPEQLAKLRPLVGGQAQGLGDLDLVEGPSVRSPRIRERRSSFPRSLDGFFSRATFTFRANVGFGARKCLLPQKSGFTFRTACLL